MQYLYIKKQLLFLFNRRAKQPIENQKEIVFIYFSFSFLFFLFFLYDGKSQRENVKCY